MMAFVLLWSIFVGYWAWSARGVKAVARAESWWARAAYAWMLVCANTIFLFGRVAPLDWRVLPDRSETFGTGFIVAALGIAFAIRARQVLGTNWSGNVTIKRDHELVRTGPYAIVRHPIYTGLLAAILGTAIAVGEVRGFVALALATTAFWTKLRREERFMTEQFGRQYETYRKQVKGLIPYVL